MEKTVASIGNYYNEEGYQPIAAPDNQAEIDAKILDIMERNPASSVLSDDDLNILRAYLPALGCEEMSTGDNGSIQGKGTVKRTSEGAGVKVESTGTVEVESIWHADRKQWIGDMRIKRVGGEAKAKEIKFDFYFLSVGMSDDNEPIVLFNEHYDRVYTDTFHLNDFDEGGVAQTSRFDISKHVQWGFFAMVTCTILTNEGTLQI